MTSNHGCGTRVLALGRRLGALLCLAVGLGAATGFGAFNTVPDGARHSAYGALCVQQTAADPWGCMPGGGTLVAPNIVLSFAHAALYMGNPYRIGFTFDEKIGPDPLVYEAEQFIPDPAFFAMDPNNPHDIAVVLLKDDVHGIRPVLLPPIVGMLDHGNVALGTFYTLVDRGPTTLEGWNGDMGTLPSLPNWMERRFGEAVAIEMRPGAIMIGPDEKHPVQPCMGSGSLALLTRTNIAVGIGSFFHAGALCGSPFAYTRLDTMGVRDFLKNYLPADLLPRYVVRARGEGGAH
jgi:hypothetical protein